LAPNLALGVVEGKPSLRPYLTFDGKAAEAMKFYNSVLGGKLSVQTFGEANMGNTPEEQKRIVHATLEHDLLTFMASDSMPGKAPKVGDNISLSIDGKDYEWLSKVFEKLSQGGRVDMPLSQQYWGDTFGMLTDRFGIHWMINIRAKPNP